jgi:hypothetical protein
MSTRDRPSAPFLILAALVTLVAIAAVVTALFVGS